MKTVSIINHKGGVGKTTFTGSIAQALSLCGFRVLVIDNDSQHNLSTMLGAGVQTPNIRSVFCAPPQEAPRQFLAAIRKTFLPNLNIVTAPRELSVRDVSEPVQLKQCLCACGLERFYDYIFIDNAPGLDVLQHAAIAASDELFVPTQLEQFAIDGIVEMEQMLQGAFPQGPHISRIIPNFYRNIKRHNSFLAALNTLFPGRITATAIPLDSVFDELVTDGKVLFLSRLHSKGAAFYLKLVHELFAFEEDALWEQVVEQRNNHRAQEARERFFRQQRPSHKEKQ